MADNCSLTRARISSGIAMPAPMPMYMASGKREIHW